jgi:hypothetical protein
MDPSGLALRMTAPLTEESFGAPQARNYSELLNLAFEIVIESDIKCG